MSTLNNKQIFIKLKIQKIIIVNFIPNIIMSAAM